MKLFILFLSLGLFLVGCKGDEEEGAKQYTLVVDNQSSKGVVVSDDQFITGDTSDLIVKADTCDTTTLVVNNDTIYLSSSKEWDETDEETKSLKKVKLDGDNYYTVTEKDGKVSVEGKDGGDSPKCPEKDEE